MLYSCLTLCGLTELLVCCGLSELCCAVCLSRCCAVRDAVWFDELMQGDIKYRLVRACSTKRFCSPPTPVALLGSLLTLDTGKQTKTATKG